MQVTSINPTATNPEVDNLTGSKVENSTCCGWPREVLSTQMHLYNIVNIHLFPVSKAGFWMLDWGNPVYSKRNFFHPEKQVQLPADNNNFFAFGNSSLEEAKVIFLCDSNHMFGALRTRRINFAVEHIFKKYGGVLLLEGKAHKPENQNMKLAGTMIKVNGWENPKTLQKIVSSADQSGTVSTMLTERNVDLMDSLKSTLPKLSTTEKVAIYIGEGHMDEQLSNELKDINYIAIYDREVILMSEETHMDLSLYYHKVLQSQLKEKARSNLNANSAESAAKEETSAAKEEIFVGQPSPSQQEKKPEKEGCILF